MLLIGSLIKFADRSIGSPIAWHYTAPLHTCRDSIARTAVTEGVPSSRGFTICVLGLTQGPGRLPLALPFLQDPRAAALRHIYDSWAPELELSPLTRIRTPPAGFELDFKEIYVVHAPPNTGRGPSSRGRTGQARAHQCCAECPFHPPLARHPG